MCLWHVKPSDASLTYACLSALEMSRDKAVYKSTDSAVVK